MKMEKLNPDVAKRLRDFYETAEGYRDREKAHPPEAQREYISIINRYTRPPRLILDLGCGIGQSSWMLGQAGFRVVGLDISFLFIRESKEKEAPGLKFVVGDTLQLPFAKGHFDVVGSFHLIEHVPDVEKALKEMVRVTKPGGLIIILGPNMLSPVHQLHSFIYSLINRKDRRIIWGQTNLLFIVKDFFKNILIWISKKFSSKVNFIYREPKRLEDKFDYYPTEMDVCYLSCPLDLKRWFEKRNDCQIIKYQGEGVSGRLFPDFGSGIHLVVRKSTY